MTPGTGLTSLTIACLVEGAIPAFAQKLDTIQLQATAKGVSIVPDTDVKELTGSTRHSASRSASSPNTCSTVCRSTLAASRLSARAFGAEVIRIAEPFL